MIIFEKIPASVAALLFCGMTHGQVPINAAKTLRAEDTVTHYVGEKWGGGIVFYIDSSGQHGLIAAENDLPGKYNPEKAKDACKILVLHGFRGWRLPGKEELKKLSLNLEAYENLYHLIFNYLTENTRILQIFERLLERYQHDEELSVADSEDPPKKSKKKLVRAIRSF